MMWRFLRLLQDEDVGFVRMSRPEMKGRQNEARKVFGPSGGIADVDSIPLAALIAVMHWNGSVTVTIGKESIGWFNILQGIMALLLTSLGKVPSVVIL